MYSPTKFVGEVFFQLGFSSPRSMALAAQVLLAINRLPMAEQMLAQMQSADDDAVITQITGAWVSIFQVFLLP